MNNRGKQFEQKMKIDFLKTIENSTIDRLYDTMNGYKSISNISDFIGYAYPNIFYLECKTHAGASIPFDKITQYDKLKEKIGIPGVRCGILLWLYDHNEVGVIYIPISTIKKMKEDGQKSFGIRHLDNENYPSYVLPTLKRKQVFLDTDYSPLMNLKDGE